MTNNFLSGVMNEYFAGTKSALKMYFNFLCCGCAAQVECSKVEVKKLQGRFMLSL